jgi:hypothetical protein
MTITGCTRCGRMDEGMNIIMFKGNPLCDDCFAIECPPITVTCSSCKTNPVTDFSGLNKTLKFCSACIEKEKQLQAANNTPEKIQERLDTLARSTQVDASIQVRTDIFNAQTVAIVELQKAIAADDTITNKPYALAETLVNRFEHLRNVVFELNKQIADAGSEQRAIHTYLNTLANSLRVEEREKLRIADINYKPQPVKQHTVKQVRTTGTSAKKASKKEIAEAAKQLGIAEFTLSAFVIQSGGNLETAVNKIKASIAAAKQ